MYYAEADLKMFIPNYNRDDCVGTSYFELHPKELPKPNVSWLADSFFLQDTAFDFFAECYFKADPDFDYFGFQRLNENEIQSLCHEIQTFISGIPQNPDQDHLFTHYEALIDMRLAWSKIQTELLAESIKTCGEQMTEFIFKNTKETKCLWVLGM